MINLYLDDTTTNVDSWRDVLVKINGSSVLDTIENDVWAIARESEEIPHIGNIYMEEIAKQLTSAIEDKYPSIETNYYVNGLDSHFYLNGERLTDLSDFTDIIEAIDNTSNSGEMDED